MHYIWFVLFSFVWPSNQNFGCLQIMCETYYHQTTSEDCRASTWIVQSSTACILWMGDRDFKIWRMNPVMKEKFIFLVLLGWVRSLVLKLIKTSYWYPSSLKHGNRCWVYELPSILPSVELNLTKAEIYSEGESTANSPCPVCLFTLLDASIDRHFAWSVRFWVSWKYLERDFIWITYTLDVRHM